MNEMITINVLADRLCKECRFYKAHDDQPLFCRNSKRKSFELSENNTCEFWEANERI